MHWTRSILHKTYNATYSRPLISRVRLVLQRLERDYQRERVEGIEELLKGDLGPREVLSGLFKGLRYPRDMTIGSTYHPKLVGTYEQEVHPFLERLLRANQYTTIVDVGVAEGFYAVGLAMRCPDARVYTYDIDPKAKDCLFELAAANGVAEQIEFGLECTADTLAEHAERSPQGLLVSDCEGYELDLFQPDLLRKLSSWDMIIETHDSLENNITQQLFRRISATHETTLVRWRRRRLGDYPGSQVASPLARLAAMDEGRTWRNKWLCCASRGQRPGGPREVAR